MYAIYIDRYTAKVGESFDRGEISLIDPEVVIGENYRNMAVILQAKGVCEFYVDSDAFWDTVESVVAHMCNRGIRVVFY